MEWIEYELKFIEVAQKNNKNKKYRDQWLNYAKNLWEHDLPIIFTQDHLCALLGFDPIYVYAVSNSPHNFKNL